MISQICNNSVREGRSWSRLPTFSKHWIDTIRGSADFFGLNYYSSRYVKRWDKQTGRNPSYFRDRNYREIISADWKRSSVFYSVANGLGDMLRYTLLCISIQESKFINKMLSIRWIKKEYNNPTVFITENGWPDSSEQDDDCIEFLQKHLQQIQHAILVDKCNVKGYAGTYIPLKTFQVKRLK